MSYTPAQTELLETCPLSTGRIEVTYDLESCAALLDLAVTLRAVVGHDWHGDRSYAFITQQQIDGDWHAFVYWGDYRGVMYRASGPAFDGPPLAGLTEGEPFALTTEATA